MTTTPFAYTQGYNANGIVATANGRYLLIVQSNTGALYRVDVASRDVIPVALGSGALVGGDGMALDGQTLYVVTGGAISVVDLTSDFASGTVVNRFSEPTFASPTSLARYDGCLLVVNSQLERQQGEPVLPFTVSSLPIPAVGTPVTATRC